MADDIFDIEWKGLKEFTQLLDNMSENVEKIVLEEYTKFGMLAEEGTKALVHHAEGNLEDSINFDKAVKEGDSIVVRGGTNVVYALRRHEEPGIGEGTAGKPAWRGYTPGPKYLENAIKAISKDYDKMNERALKRILGTNP
ncbi:HK97 gp10 family phage protein [Ornithinibacillus sp. L9]|uniref:HK97 gp10 family phage protein n=1 Tax=Ornithinibacillus caprae TaxID=2678566 RepID=A0A6N8FLB7_9BACI|nr:HK97 gp10 family phage protein [Ornithinibacillus caprae]MUK89154.1 HK97 gp10 family phage protein [Ornithinibacillus caprae]